MNNRELCAHAAMHYYFYSIRQRIVSYARKHAMSFAIVEYVKTKKIDVNDT